MEFLNFFIECIKEKDFFEKYKVEKPDENHDNVLKEKIPFDSIANQVEIV